MKSIVKATYLNFSVKIPQTCVLGYLLFFFFTEVWKFEKNHFCVNALNFCPNLLNLDLSHLLPHFIVKKKILFKVPAFITAMNFSQRAPFRGLAAFRARFCLSYQQKFAVSFLIGKLYKSNRRGERTCRCLMR